MRFATPANQVPIRESALEIDHPRWLSTKNEPSSVECSSARSPFVTIRVHSWFENHTLWTGGLTPTARLREHYFASEYTRISSSLRRYTLRFANAGCDQTSLREPT